MIRLSNLWSFCSCFAGKAASQGTQRFGRCLPDLSSLVQHCLRFQHKGELV